MRGNVNTDRFGHGIPISQLIALRHELRRNLLPSATARVHQVFTVAQVTGNEPLAVCLAILYSYPLEHHSFKRLQSTLVESGVSDDLCEFIGGNLRAGWQQRNWPIRLIEGAWLNTIERLCLEQDQLWVLLHLARLEAFAFGYSRNLGPAQSDNLTSTNRIIMVREVLHMVRKIAETWESVLPEIELMLSRLQFTLTELDPDESGFFGEYFNQAPFKWVGALERIQHSEVEEKHLQMHSGEHKGLSEGMRWARERAVVALEFKKIMGPRSLEKEQ